MLTGAATTGWPAPSCTRTTTGDKGVEPVTDCAAPLWMESCNADAATAYPSNCAQTLGCALIAVQAVAPALVPAGRGPSRAGSDVAPVEFVTVLVAMVAK